MNQTLKSDLVKSSPAHLALGSALIVLGLAIAGAGVYVGETDDAPGAALMGFGLMLVAVFFGVKIARRKG